MQRTIARILEYLALCHAQIFTHFFHIDSVFQFQHDFADIHQFHLGDSGFVGTEHTIAKPPSQQIADIPCSRLRHLLLPMFQIDIDQMVERRIAEGAALVEQVVEKGLVVVDHHLLDDGQLRTLGLQQHHSPFTFSPCPAAHLRHHHEGMLVGTEIGVVEHRVSIEDSHHGNAVEIQTFGNHLRTDEQIGTTCREVADDALVGRTGARGVEIHTRHLCLRENRHNLVLDFLRSIAASLQFRGTAAGAHRRHLITAPTIVASHLLGVFMIGERHITVRAMRHPTALPTFYHRRKTATVLEQDNLLPCPKRLSDAGEQRR